MKRSEPAGQPGLRPGSHDAERADRPISKILFSRSAFLFWLALAGALALAAGSRTLSSSARLSNFELPETGFPHAYLMLSKRDKDRGYLVDRRDSTVRRNRKNLPGRAWWVRRFGGETGVADHWLLTSKREPTVVFVPAEAVPDPTYPLLYDLVRAEAAPELPPAAWTQLYVDRVYRGLYLRLDLPFDPRRKDGGSGVRREILSVRGETMTLVDTRFDPDSRLYASLVSDGVFPRLLPPSPAVAWLASRRGLAGGETTLLLADTEPHRVTLLPLPLSVAQLAERLYGPLAATRDERFRRWSEGWQRSEPPFDATRRERLDHQLRAAASGLRAAVGAYRAFRGVPFDLSPFAELDPGGLEGAS